MKTTWMLLIAAVFSTKLQAQRDTTLLQKATIDTAAILDSMALDLAALADLLDEPTSYFNASVNVGNQLFSKNNFSLNSQQANSNITGFKPGLGYYHKSGLSISGIAFLNLSNSSDGFYQYSLSPGYDKEWKKWSAGISYTRYFTTAKDTIPGFATPYDNEFYGFVNRTTGLIQPGLIVGYGIGKYTSVFRGRVMGPLGNPVFVTDSQRTKQGDFSLSLVAQHEFYTTHIFSKNDDLYFTPTLMLNAGDYKTSVLSHSNKLVNTILNRGPKNRFKVENEGFKVYSLGLALNLIYETGIFYLQPELYLDYYLPKTDKQFTGIFSITAGVNF